MIYFKSASFVFGHTTVFEDVNLQFNSTTIYYIDGKNGAGKTTFLEAAAGLRSLSAGTLSIDTVVARYYLGHRCGLSMQLSPRENLRFLMASASRNRTKPSNKSLMDALSYFSLAPIADVPSRQLSAGQKRKVLLSSLLLSDANALLLDEPYNALDESSCTRLNSILNEKRNNGCMILLTSHNLPALADMKHLHLKDGTFTSSGGSD